MSPGGQNPGPSLRPILQVLSGRLGVANAGFDDKVGRSLPALGDLPLRSLSLASAVAPAGSGLGWALCKRHSCGRCIPLNMVSASLSRLPLLESA